jgi:hypothetical protein
MGQSVFKIKEYNNSHQNQPSSRVRTDFSTEVPGFVTES